MVGILRRPAEDHEHRLAAPQAQRNRRAAVLLLPDGRIADGQILRLPQLRLFPQHPEGDGRVLRLFQPVDHEIDVRLGRAAVEHLHAGRPLGGMDFIIGRQRQLLHGIGGSAEQMSLILAGVPEFLADLRDGLVAGRIVLQARRLLEPAGDDHRAAVQQPFQLRRHLRQDHAICRIGDVVVFPAGRKLDLAVNHPGVVVHKIVRRDQVAIVSALERAVDGEAVHDLLALLQHRLATDEVAEECLARLEPRLEPAEVHAPFIECHARLVFVVEGLKRPMMQRHLVDAAGERAIGDVLEQRGLLGPHAHPWHRGEGFGVDHRVARGPGAGRRLEGHRAVAVHGREAVVATGGGPERGHRHIRDGRALDRIEWPAVGFERELDFVRRHHGFGENPVIGEQPVDDIHIVPFEPCRPVRVLDDSAEVARFQAAHHRTVPLVGSQHRRAKAHQPRDRIVAFEPDELLAELGRPVLAAAFVAVDVEAVEGPAVQWTESFLERVDDILPMQDIGILVHLVHLQAPLHSRRRRVRGFHGRRIADAIDGPFPRRHFPR